MPRILVVDNYDSFVYILVQYLGELGAEPLVVRNDKCTIEEMVALEPDGVLISPGPGRPEDAGLSSEIILEFAGKKPVFGVCLGLQCIGQIYGGTVSNATELMHGKTSMVTHRGQGVFSEVASPLEATRYHSLIVEPEGLPETLEVTAETSDGTIMGLRHKTLDVEGVQFHPESVLTVYGKQLVNNFLLRCA